MKILSLIPILFLLSCASKNNLSDQYKFTGKLNVIVNGTDSSEDCILVLNSSQGLAWKVHEIKIGKDGALNFSSKLKENYFNTIICTPGFIASKITHIFKSEDIKVNALKTEELNIGEFVVDWKTESYASGIGVGVAIELVTGLNTNKTRSTDNFTVKHITEKQNNTEVLISKRLLIPNPHSSAAN